jgi:hypothetical protein
MNRCVIYHNQDLDGWMSAAIVKYWYESLYPGKTVHLGDIVLDPDDEKGRSLNFIGWNYGDPIPDLSPYDQVIMCDISFPPTTMSALYTDKNKELIWIDHHISAISDSIAPADDKIRYDRDGSPVTVPYNEAKGLRYTQYAACELTWKYFFPDKEMPEIVRQLGRYDCFGHKGTYEEQLILEFQYGARALISNYKQAYEYLDKSLKFGTPVEEERDKYVAWYNRKTGNLEHRYVGKERVVIGTHKRIESEIRGKGIHIYEYLKKDAKSTYKSGFPVMFDYPDGTQKKFICFNKNRFNPVNFGIDYHKDGYDGAACFWRKSDGNWAFSLYNDNKKLDCSLIAKQFGGGGHAGASGFITKDIEKILT